MAASGIFTSKTWRCNIASMTTEDWASQLDRERHQERNGLRGHTLLHMIDQRLPTIDPGGCLGELRNAPRLLDRHGFVGRPSWNNIRVGIQPEGDIRTEPGGWPHGWQYTVSSSPEHNFKKNVVLNWPICVHIQGQSFEQRRCSLRTIILERVRLPLQVTEVRCECGTPLDSRGCRRVACSQSGRLNSRTHTNEICAAARNNAKLRDLDLAISANDDRAMEALATGLPLFFGAQLAVNIDGVVCTTAGEDKKRKYSDLLRTDTCHHIPVCTVLAELFPNPKAWVKRTCEGDGDAVGVVTPLSRSCAGCVARCSSCRGRCAAQGASGQRSGRRRGRTGRSRKGGR